ncbi:hypothetical protein [Mycoplasma sp. Z1473D]
MDNQRIKLKKPSDLSIYETVYAISISRALLTSLIVSSSFLYVLLYVLTEVATVDGSKAYFGLWIFNEIFSIIYFIFVFAIFDYGNLFSRYKNIIFPWDSQKFSTEALIYLYLTTESFILERYIVTFMRKQFGSKHYFNYIKHYLLQEKNS